MSGYFWIEYENDDMGPFASREVAAMALGTDEGVIFEGGLNGCTPIAALVSPAWQSSQVEWSGADERYVRILSGRALNRARSAVTQEP